MPPAAPPPLPNRKRAKRPRRRHSIVEPFSNALLGWEVLRAGRRTGTQAIARTALGGVLLAAMWALWTASFGDDTSLNDTGTNIGKELNRFAEWFAFTFFMVQATVVMLLTPVLVAGAIFEERETRSGEVLLTTELTRREVYVGKLGARMVQVLLVIFAGMPILFLTQLWGGVSMEMIVINYSATALTIVGAGVVTAAISAYAETLRGAILRSYGLLLLIDVSFFPASPYLVISMSRAHWIAGLSMMAIFVPMQAIIVFVGYFIGQRWLRMAMLRQKTRLPTRPGLPPPLPGASGRRLPPLNDDADPLVWKELNTIGRITLREGLSGHHSCAGRATVDDRMDEMGAIRWLIASREAMAFLVRILAGMTIVLLVLLTIFDEIPSNWTARVAGGLALSWLMCRRGPDGRDGNLARTAKADAHRPADAAGPAPRLASRKGDWRDGPRSVASNCDRRHSRDFGDRPWSLDCFGGSPHAERWRACTILDGDWHLAIGSMPHRLERDRQLDWHHGRHRDRHISLGRSESRLGRRPAIAAPRMDYPAWTRVVNPLLAWGRLTFSYDYEAGRYVWGRGRRRLAANIR